MRAHDGRQPGAPRPAQGEQSCLRLRPPPFFAALRLSTARSPRLPQPTGKPRVICLTAKRRTAKRGFKGTLHVCKLAQGRYQARHWAQIDRWAARCHVQRVPSPHPLPSSPACRCGAACGSSC
jgi:hypothetical protein